MHILLPWMSTNRVHNAAMCTAGFPALDLNLGVKVVVAAAAGQQFLLVVGTIGVPAVLLAMPVTL